MGKSSAPSREGQIDGRFQLLRVGTRKRITFYRLSLALGERMKVRGSREQRAFD
jgi:hypothetical protein